MAYLFYYLVLSSHLFSLMFISQTTELSPFRELRYLRREGWCTVFRFGLASVMGTREVETRNHLGTYRLFLLAGWSNQIIRAQLYRYGLSVWTCRMIYSYKCTWICTAIVGVKRLYFGIFQPLLLKLAVFNFLNYYF